MGPRRISVLTDHVKRYDRDLYVEISGGKPCVMRRTLCAERYDVNGESLVNLRPQGQLVFALTEDWTMRTHEVEWGLLPILERLKSIDLCRDPDYFKRIMDDLEKADASQERDRKNNIESFLLDFRRQFAKTFDDVNTSTMSKIDKRRNANAY